MEIKFHQVKNIFDTLPIGYYLGRRIKVNLSETGNVSFYNPAADEITVSAPNIISAFKPVAEGASIDLEEVIRGLLYHEVSHVILTCGNKETNEAMVRECKHDILNIMEDERIETLLHDYYMLTNFRRNTFFLNQYDGTRPPKTDMERFYHLVRFHEGSEVWLKKLENFITKWKNLNASSGYWDWVNYAEEVNDFYRDFTHASPEETQPEGGYGNNSGESQGEGQGQGSGEQGESEGQGQQNGQNGQSEGQEDGNGMNGNQDAGESENGQNEGQDGSVGDPAHGQGKNPDNIRTNPGKKVHRSEEDEKSQAIEEQLNRTRELEVKVEPQKIMETALKRVFNKYEDPTLQKKLEHIINVSQKKKGMLLGARLSYSGKINPRACGREDYMWWKKVNGGGSLNGIDKLHFNLFIDNSGSFCDNDDQVNKLIRALNKIKSPMFDFDVITINHHVDEWTDTTSKLFESDGGNCLNSNMYDIFKRHQMRNSNNFNIVLFDGDAHSNDWGNERLGPDGKDCFGAFDSPNTIIISDRDNTNYINESVTKARVVITRNYCSEFIKNILVLLEQML